MPQFSESYFNILLKETKTTIDTESKDVIFSKTKAMKRKVKDSDVDMIVASANGFYGKGVTNKMVDDYYASRIDKNDERPIEYGLNSTMELIDGKLKEVVWKSGGKYGKAIDKIIYWLKKAVTVAENKEQKASIEHMSKSYKSSYPYVPFS